MTVATRAISFFGSSSGRATRTPFLKTSLLFLLLLLLLLLLHLNVQYQPQFDH